MSVPFSSDEAESIHRQISNEDKALIDSIVNIPYTVSLELDRCVKWITDHKFSKVALQFPDNLLGVCSSVAQFLTARTEAKFFVLADTSYGSCCVDEVTADHVSADAIIHFGHACLSLTERLPVLYIFAKYCLDVPHVISSFKECFPDVFSSVIIYYEVNYHHIIGEVAENLKEYENLVISELAFSKEDYRTVLEKNKTEIIKNQRSFILPKTKDLKNYTVFYIGCQLEAFNNVMLSLNKCRFYFYNTLKKTVEDNTKCISRFLSKRYYYVERTKDARIIGILVGTLGVSNYISTIKRLREAIIKANKKSYVIVVGKRNVAKLANFVNIEVFVNVACLESTVVDCRQFLQPIITPYELEIALNIREWTDEYITNFAELLPDGAHHVPISEMKQETDVSLITGKIRSLGSSNISDEIKDKSSTAVVQRDEMAISDIHSEAAGEFLSQCSWKGLEQKLGETPIADIQPGRKGIASGYEDEKTEQNR